MTAVQWWADHGRAAALDRLRTGRPIDGPFVAALDADCAGTVRQRGGDVETALLALHAGLYSAHATTIGGATPRHAAYAPSDAELAALQCDLDELERTDPAVRASAQALDAAIRRLNRRTT